MAIFTTIAVITSAVIVNSLWFVGLATTNWVAAGLIKLGLGFIISAIAKKELGVGPTPKAPFGVSGTLQRGGTLDQSFIFGRYATAGSLMFSEEWDWSATNTNTMFRDLQSFYNIYSKRGSVTYAQFTAGLNGTWQREIGSSGIPNQYLTQVIQLSDLPVRGLHGLILNEEPVTIEDTSPHEVFGRRITSTQSGTKDYNGYAWIKFYDGNQTESDVFLTTTFGGDPNYPIDENFIGKGNAYAIVTTKIREGEVALWTGFPKFLFILDGIELLSASTGNKATVHDNPVDVIYTILRGISYEDEWFYGSQKITSSQLNNTLWGAQALKAANAGYTCGGEIKVNEDPLVVIEELLFSFNGKIAESGGQILVLAVEPDASVVSFVDDDVIATEEQVFYPFKEADEIYNGVSVDYPSPDDNWETITAPPLYSPTYEADDDGRRKISDIQMPFVTDDEQVQRIMKAILAEGRRERRHAVPLPSKYWQIEPLDVVTWTSARNGYTAKKFLVVSVVDAANGDIVLDMTEIDDADFVWTRSTDFTPITKVPLVPPTTAIQEVAGWEAEPEFLVDVNGNPTTLGIRINWTPVGGDLDYLAYQIRVRNTDQTLLIEGQTFETESGTRLITGGFTVNTDYEIRAKFVARPARETAWTAWTLVDPTPISEPTVVIDDFLSRQGRSLITSMRVNVVSESSFYNRAQIRIRKDIVNQKFLAINTGPLGDFNVPVVDDGVRYEIEVSLVSHSGETASPYSYFHVVLGKTARPTAPTDFSINSHGQNATLSWVAPEDLDVSHYIIKHSSVLLNADYSNAVTMVKKVPRPATSVEVPSVEGTYFIRTVDKTNLTSVDSAYTILDKGANLERGHNTVVTVNAHPNFTGTYSKALKVDVIENNVTIPGVQMDPTYFTFTDSKGVFYAPDAFTFSDQIGPWWEGTFDFAGTDLGASFFCAILPTVNLVYKNLDDDLVWSGIPGLMSTWEGLISTQTDYTGGVPSLSDSIDYDILASTTNDDPDSVTAEWTAYTVITNRKVKMRGVRFRAVLRSRFKEASPRVLGISVDIDMPDRIVRNNDVDVTGSKNITYTTGFYEVPSTGVTANNLSNGQRVRVYNKTKTGFSVQVLNANNAQATNTIQIDWVSNGFGER